MEIKINSYYILKNSEDPSDAIKILETWPGWVKFEYFIKTPFIVNTWGDKRTLHVKAFEKCYKPFATLNILYSTTDK